MNNNDNEIYSDEEIAEAVEKAKQAIYKGMRIKELADFILKMLTKIASTD